MSSNKRSVLLFAVVLIAFVLVVANTAFYYGGSSLLPRLVLFGAFTILFTALILVSTREGSSNDKYVMLIFFFSSLFFLICRSLFFKPEFLEQRLNLESAVRSQQYSFNGRLVFDSPHSYFFVQSLVVSLLHTVGGFSFESLVYFSLLLYAVLVTLVAFLVYTALMRQFLVDSRRKSLGLIISLIGFMIISFAYSARSGAVGFYAYPTMVALWLVFGKRISCRSEAAVLLLLVIGTTLGDPTGIIIFIPLFIVLSIVGRQRSAIVYAIIPAAYLSFCSSSYTLSLVFYTRSAFVGFAEFLQRVLLGNVPQEILPWQKASSMTRVDTYITSVAYFSLLLLSFLVIVSSVFLWTRRKVELSRDNDVLDRVCVVCLTFFLMVSAITYVGVSVGTETTYSDIRTIVVYLLSLVLPFVFFSNRLTSILSSKKALSLLVIALVVTASMRSAYEVYPKSASDPVYVVEDSRLGSDSIFATANFLNYYCKISGIILDYKVLNAINPRLSESDFEIRRLSQAALTAPFTVFPNRTLLVFSTLGTSFPSLYQSPADYAAAYNFSKTNNRSYDNGVVVVASSEKHER